MPFIRPGITFNPSAQDPNETRKVAGALGPAQQALKVLSLRLPQVLGARRIVPSQLSAPNAVTGAGPSPEAAVLQTVLRNAAQGGAAQGGSLLTPTGGGDGGPIRTTQPVPGPVGSFDPSPQPPPTGNPVASAGQVVPQGGSELLDLIRAIPRTAERTAGGTIDPSFAPRFTFGGGDGSSGGSVAPPPAPAPSPFGEVIGAGSVDGARSRALELLKAALRPRTATGF